jgi:hypothetical protein
MRSLLGSCMAVGAMVIATACGSSSSPSSTQGVTALIAGNYTLSVQVTPSSPALPFPTCATATLPISQESTVVAAFDNGRWRMTPKTAADGAFEMVLDQITNTQPGRSDWTGSIRGIVKETRQGWKPTSVAFGDGASAVALSGTTLNSQGSGVLAGAATFSGGDFAAFTCVGSSVGWLLTGPIR